MCAASEAPRFTVPLGGREGKTVYVDPGAGHVLECDAAGVPTPAMVWHRDGQRLGPGSLVNAYFNSNFTRSILHVASVCLFVTF